MTTPLHLTDDERDELERAIANCYMAHARALQKLSDARAALRWLYTAAHAVYDEDDAFTVDDVTGKEDRDDALGKALTPARAALWSGE